MATAILATLATRLTVVTRCASTCVDTLVGAHLHSWLGVRCADPAGPVLRCSMISVRDVSSRNVSVLTISIEMISIEMMSVLMISVRTIRRGEGDAPSKRARALTKTDPPDKIFFLAYITLCTCSATSPSAPES